MIVSEGAVTQSYSRDWVNNGDVTRRVVCRDWFSDSDNTVLSTSHAAVLRCYLRRCEDGVTKGHDMSRFDVVK